MTGRLYRSYWVACLHCGHTMQVWENYDVTEEGARETLYNRGWVREPVAGAYRWMHKACRERWGNATRQD